MNDLSTWLADWFDITGTTQTWRTDQLAKDLVDAGFCDAPEQSRPIVEGQRFHWRSSTLFVEVATIEMSCTAVCEYQEEDGAIVTIERVRAGDLVAAIERGWLIPVAPDPSFLVAKPEQHQVTEKQIAPEVSGHA